MTGMTYSSGALTRRIRIARAEAKREALVAKSDVLLDRSVEALAVDNVKVLEVIL